MSIFIIIFKISENFSKIPRIFLKLSLYNSSKILNFDFQHYYMSKCINSYKNDERNLTQISKFHKNPHLTHFQFSKITKITFIIIQHFSSFFNSQPSIFIFMTIFIIIFKILKNFSKIPRDFLKTPLY